MQLKKVGIAGAVIALVSVTSVSQVAAMDVKGHIKLGYDTGGETLVTVGFVGGDSESIKSGEGFYFGGGVALVSDDKSFETELSLSYKFGEITASNGDVTWTRMPLDVLAFYRMDKVRLGGGMTYHLNPELESSGVVPGPDVDFDNSLGFVVQADWRMTDSVNLGARYTIMDYELKGSSGKVDASGVGIVFSGSF